MKVVNIQDYLSNTRTIGSYKLKVRLLKSGLMKHTCNRCHGEKWENEPIPLELHHIDGQKRNNTLTNLQLLCPNCHVFTNNYRGKNKIRTKKNIKLVTDEELMNSIKESYNRSEALVKLNLRASGGNYDRINRILNTNQLKFKEAQVTNIIYKEYKTRINWPDKDILIEKAKKQSILSIARELGVSDNAIRKRLKKLGIQVSLISPYSHNTF